MKGTKTAGRYAKALLELSIENKSNETVVANMQTLLNASKDSREFEVFLQSPVINPEKKTEIFNTIFNGFDQLTKLFVGLIIKNGREGILPQIAKSYIEQLKAHLGITPVTLISATQLDDSTKATIVAKVEKAIAGKIELEEKIDTTLLGGFIVEMGDQRIDASVVNQLNNIKQRLTR